jgi:hypothetical protein
MCLTTILALGLFLPLEVLGSLQPLFQYIDTAWDLRCCPLEEESQPINITRQIISASETHALVSTQSHSRCVNPTYMPRVLSTRQISWKSSPKESDSDKQGRSKKDRNGTAEGETNNNNGTASSTDNNNNNHHTRKSTGDQNDIVHKFLAFGLALPRHPFSSSFLTTMKAVAPLFPGVTVIVGNGDEFDEFAQQYNVRSYPKLLVFNEGVLHGRYTATFGRGLYSEADMIEYFSKWTGSAPASVPLPRELRGWNGKEGEFRLLTNLSSYGEDQVQLLQEGNTRGGYSPPTNRYGKIALSKAPKKAGFSLWEAIHGLAVGLAERDRDGGSGSDISSNSSAVSRGFAYLERQRDRYFDTVLEPIADQEMDVLLYLVSAVYVLVRAVGSLRRGFSLPLG